MKLCAKSIEISNYILVNYFKLKPKTKYKKLYITMDWTAKTAATMKQTKQNKIPIR